MVLSYVYTGGGCGTGGFAQHLDKVFKWLNSKLPILRFLFTNCKLPLCSRKKAGMPITSIMDLLQTIIFIIAMSDMIIMQNI